MSVEHDLLARVGADKVVATEAGLQWIEDNKEVIELFAAFCEAERGCANPQVVFQDHQFVGVGGRSEVHKLCDHAVKLSTPTTGRYPWKHGDSSVENLILQQWFLSGLRNWLSDSGIGDIVIPKQFVAFRTPRRNYLRVEQLMEGWSTVDNMERSQQLGYEEAVSINDRIKARINLLNGPLAIRVGLSDLGLGNGENLNSKNVLIPDDSDNIAEAPLCIIDQPLTILRCRNAALAIMDFLGVRCSGISDARTRQVAFGSRI